MGKTVLLELDLELGNVFLKHDHLFFCVCGGKEEGEKRLLF